MPSRPVTGNLLLVEDDAALCEMLKEALTNDGYIVRTASSGMDAVRTLASVDVDLIVLDIVLPWLSGIEILRMITSDARTWEVPVIVITGAPVGAAELAQFRNVKRMLRKPFDSDELVAAVQEVLYGGAPAS